MSNTITISIPALAVTKAELERRASLVRKAMVQGLRLSAELVRGETQQKLTGPVLKVQTGRLRNSIHYLLTQGPRPFVRIGTNVVYGAIHEFGGTIRHPGGTAYFPIGAGKARFISNKVAALHGREFPRTRAHNITMPERSFLRSSLAESTPGIREVMVEKLTEAIKGDAA